MEEILRNVEGSYPAKLTGNCDQYRLLLHGTKALLWRDKERYGACVETCLEEPLQIVLYSGLGSVPLGGSPHKWKN